MIKPELKIDRRVLKKIKAKYEDFDAEVGILKDKPYRLPQAKSKGFDSINGRKVRKMSRKTRGTIGEVSERMRKEHADYLRAPFEKPNSTAMRALRKSLFEFLKGDISRKEAEAALQHVIRNPIWRKVYGANADSTVKGKGFNWKLVDTAQFFKNIIANIKRRSPKDRNV